MKRRSARTLRAALLMGIALAVAPRAGAETVLVTGGNAGLGLDFVKE